MRHKVTKNKLRDSISFRPETPEDHDFLLGLYASTRAAEMAVVPWTDQEKDSFVRMQFFAQSKHYKESYDADWLIVLREGQPIGRLYLHQLEGDLRIVDITLLPEQRGQGLGRMLLEELMEKAGAKGDKVSIHVENFNPALRLYERLGFREVSTYGVYYLMEWLPPAR